MPVADDARPKGAREKAPTKAQKARLPLPLPQPSAPSLPPPFLRAAFPPPRSRRPLCLRLGPPALLPGSNPVNFAVFLRYLPD